MNIRTTTPRSGARLAGLVAGLTVIAALATATAASHVTLPLMCNQGPRGQRFNVGVTMPSTVEAGATYTIRLDGDNSGNISHFGLNYLHDMTVEYVLPAGVSYVDGSAQLVAGTGTPNVRAGGPTVAVEPRVSHRAGIVTMRLPGKVANGTDYTPPSITLQVRAVGAPGSSAVLGFNHFQLKANAFLVGDVSVSCDPEVQPYPIGATAITAPAQAVPIR